MPLPQPSIILKYLVPQLLEVKQTELLRSMSRLSTHVAMKSSVVAAVMSPTWVKVHVLALLPADGEIVQPLVGEREVIFTLPANFATAVTPDTVEPEPVRMSKWNDQVPLPELTDELLTAHTHGGVEPVA